MFKTLLGVGLLASILIPQPKLLAGTGAPTGAQKAIQRDHIRLRPTVGYIVKDRFAIGDGSGSGSYNQVLTGKPAIVAGLGLAYTHDLVPGFSVQFGVLYEFNRRFEGKASYTDSRTIVESRTTVIVDYIAVPVMGRYSFGQAAVRPYVEIGPTFRGVAAMRKNETYVRFVSGNEGKGKYIVDTQPLTLGGAVGGGIDIGTASGHYLSLGVRGELMSGLIHGAEGSGRITTGSVILAYTLTK
jgi:hypothetical protein